MILLLNNSFNNSLTRAMPGEDLVLIPNLN